MTQLGEKILKLRGEGKDYDEICQLLGCSKSTVNYWCGKDGQENAKRRYHDRRNKIVRLIQEVKNDRPCADCGKKYPYYAMQFDHLPQHVKHFTVSEAKTRLMSLEKVKEEISKCEVVCANCHAIRTWRRRNGGLS